MAWVLPRCTASTILMDTRVAGILDPQYIARRRSRKIDEVRLLLTNQLARATVWLTFRGGPRSLPSSTNGQNSKRTIVTFNCNWVSVRKTLLFLLLVSLKLSIKRTLFIRYFTNSKTSESYFPTRNFPINYANLQSKNMYLSIYKHSYLWMILKSFLSLYRS